MVSIGKNILRSFHSIMGRMRGRFPSALPRGVKEFEAFSESILRTYDLPDRPSYRHAIATMIMHLNPQVSYAPKIYFARSIQKAMANEIAFQKIQEYKELEKKKNESEATPQLEATNGATGRH